MSTKKQAGCLVWITGFPGAGKTALANELYKLIKDVTHAVRTDGDLLRQMMRHDLGYTPDHRKINEPSE